MKATFKEPGTEAFLEKYNPTPAQLRQAKRNIAKMKALRGRMSSDAQKWTRDVLAVDVRDPRIFKPWNPPKASCVILTFDNKGSVGSGGVYFAHSKKDIRQMRDKITNFFPLPRGVRKYRITVGKRGRGKKR